MIYPASHPLLPAVPTRKSSEFSFLANCISLLLLLYLQDHSLKPNPHSSHIPGSWFYSHTGKQAPSLVFSKYCSSYAFLPVCWLIRWDLGACFVWCSAFFCSASPHHVVSCGKKRVCMGVWSPDFSWGRVEPTGNSGTSGCFLPYGICAGGNTLEMFI